MRARVHLDGVRAVGHDLRLDDGHEAVLLADGGVLREVLHAHVDGEVRRDALDRVNLQARAKAKVEVEM